MVDGTFAAIAVTLYAAHHVGDYWMQTDRQAQCKGKPGREGRDACLAHVASYVLTQYALLQVAGLVLGFRADGWGVVAGMAVSAVTHYMADRRDYGLMFKLVRRSWNAGLLRFGQGERTVATGAWALDQAWHIFWGVWVFALLAVAW